LEGLQGVARDFEQAPRAEGAPPNDRAGDGCELFDLAGRAARPSMEGRERLIDRRLSWRAVRGERAADWTRVTGSPAPCDQISQRQLRALDRPVCKSRDVDTSKTKSWINILKQHGLTPLTDCEYIR
jgi:hypothetical protein